MRRLTILDILDRVHSGPVCTGRDWDVKMLPTKVADKVNKYGLKNTCRPENPINCDDALADQFFKAGFELAVDLGMFCVDTERVIKVTAEELLDCVRRAPAELIMGEGPDRVVAKVRMPEDKQPPLFCSPLGIVVDEDLWIPMVQAIAQYKEIDEIIGPSFATAFGRPILAGTPYETYAGRLEAQMRREALWRAGRPGMPRIGTQSTTEYWHLGGYGTHGGYDPNITIAICNSPAEIKTNYGTLHKVVHTLNCGGLVYSGTHSFIGGYSGPPEGAAVANVACTLLVFAVHQASIAGGYVYDLRYNGNCGRAALWANSIGVQAVSRNLKRLKRANVNQTAGPCTEMILYESAVGLMNASVSGASFSNGPRSAGGRYENYLSPLECKFCAEVFKACAGMSRAQANEIANKILPKYEDKLNTPPKGKSFTECFDIKTLEPTKEWLDIYLRIKKELIGLGIPLAYP